MKRSVPGPGAVIKGILGLQLGMAGLMFGADLLGGWQGLSFGPAAPRLETPVRPGDQTRRYRPGDRPPAPANRPFPAPVKMPERLMFEPVQRDGVAMVRITGTIAPGDGARFADWLSMAAQKPAVVVLNSPGGSVADALDIGRTLRAAGIDTTVTAGDICLSACPYILAGGVRRVVSDDGFVGVHQHYFGQNVVQPAFMAVEDIQRGQGQVMVYLNEMGVDPMLMRHALTTPPDEIYILLPEELARYRIVTGTTEG
ncbi:MAG: hypothetical protein GW905_06080 [Rhodobacterales bacterium]|nr:hypothetical protein [Rhodobacterales bacterium]